MRLSKHHCEVFSLVLPEAFYTQLPSPEMTTFDPKRKTCKFIKSFAPVPLQLERIIQCPCPTIEGSHWVHFHLRKRAHLRPSYESGPEVEVHAPLFLDIRE